MDRIGIVLDSPQNFITLIRGFSTDIIHNANASPNDKYAYTYM